MYLMEIGCDDTDWINTVQDKVGWLPQVARDTNRRIS
jgi:hypothetical protein